MTTDQTPESYSASTEPFVDLGERSERAPLICKGVDCTSAIDQLYEYLDGHCQQVDRDVIEIHLEECSPCLNAFEFHQELHDLVQSRCKSELPDGLRDKVLGALKDLEFEQDSAQE